MRSEHVRRGLLAADAAGVAAIVTLAAVWWVFGYRPLETAHADRQAQVREVQAAANERESLESSVAAAKARVERLRERIRAESIQLGKLEDLNARNNALARLAEESRLRLDTIRPGDVVPGVRYTGVPIRLLGTGTYAECVEFLERLRRVFPDVGVNAFDLRSVPGGGASFVFDLVWFTAPTARPSPSAQISSSGAGVGP